MPAVSLFSPVSVVSKVDSGIRLAVTEDILSRDVTRNIIAFVADFELRSISGSQSDLSAQAS